MSRKNAERTMMLKLVKIKNALPSGETMMHWNPAAKAFVENVRRILEES